MISRRYIHPQWLKRSVSPIGRNVVTASSKPFGAVGSSSSYCCCLRARLDRRSLVTLLPDALRSRPLVCTLHRRSSGPATRNMAARPQRNRPLLLTFDAFDTLFTPRESVPKQYADVARRHGLQVTEDQLAACFPGVYKEQWKQHPNYGYPRPAEREDAIVSSGGGDGISPEDPYSGSSISQQRQGVEMTVQHWWEQLIRKVIATALREAGRPDQEVPEAMLHELYTRFSTDQGYVIYDDVLPFLRELADLTSPSSSASSSTWPHAVTIVGIVSNSDPRVSSVLASMGVSVRVDPCTSEPESGEGGSRPGARTRTPSAPTGAHRDGTRRPGAFDFATYSYVVGHAKPDVRIFRAAEEQARRVLLLMGGGGGGAGGADIGGEGSGAVAAAAEAATQTTADFRRVHVGDEVEKDAAAAVEAGWEAVVVDRKRRGGGGGDDNSLAATWTGTTAAGHRYTGVNSLERLRDVLSLPPPPSSSSSSSSSSRSLQA